MFVKESMKDIFKLKRMNNDDAIRVKMNKNSSSGIGTDQKISKLSEDVIYRQEKGEVIIIGD